MPNRIIKDSIRTSKSINAMSDFQFRLWAYLITYVDDYGRGSADPELLKGFVFPRNPEEVGGEPQTASPPVVSIPLNDGTEYPVSQEQCQEWAGVYPAVDVIQQLREMREWCLNNPAKWKTARGVRGFITRWLAKEQDRGGRKGAKGPCKCEDAWGYV